MTTRWTRSTRSMRGLVVALGAAGGCDRALPPAGQIVLYIDTDAIVRDAVGPRDDASLSPMVDRARFEVLRDGQTLPNSTRDVAIDAAMLRERRLSFGIVMPSDERDVHVRVRLFRADRVLGPEPPSGVTLDTTVALPAVASEGIVERTIVLRTDDFGTRIGPVAPSPGPPAASLVGTWRGGRRAPCAEGARPGEACVPGASFFLGNPQFRGRSAANDIFEERLVWVSPFFVDVTEVTVGAFRARWPEISARVAPPTATADEPFCTWTAAPEADRESRALNCVPWATAQAYCEAVGKTLPAEAQQELLASGAGDEWSFPWGNDEPSCAGAVWGCAGIPGATNDAIRRGADQCRGERPGPGPFAPGQGLADRVPSAVLRNAGGEDVLDVGGNLAEWARDVWARPTDAAWSSTRPMIDPLNTQPNAVDGDAHPVRGGDWASTALTTRVGFRRQLTEPSPVVGFRCARAARPR